MSDLKKYVTERKGRDRKFAEGFDDRNFAALLRH